MRNNYRRVLSNRFAGNTDSINIEYSDKSISAGIANHMTISVQNASTTYALPFAIIPANFDTQRITATSTESSGSITTTITNAENNCAEMNTAGYMVNGVAHDGSYTDVAKNVNYTCASADPTQTIKSFLRYLKLNPTKLKSIEVVSNNANAFDTNMSLTYVNPFFKNAVQNIDLSTFYSLYQYSNDRIRIDFTDDNVELNDLSLLTATIPASTTMKFILRFK